MHATPLIPSLAHALKVMSTSHTKTTDEDLALLATGTTADTLLAAASFLSGLAQRSLRAVAPVAVHAEGAGDAKVVDDAGGAEGLPGPTSVGDASALQMYSALSSAMGGDVAQARQTLALIDSGYLASCATHQMVAILLSTVADSEPAGAGFDDFSQTLEATGMPRLYGDDDEASAGSSPSEDARVASFRAMWLALQQEVWASARAGGSGATSLEDLPAFEELEHHLARVALAEGVAQGAFVLDARVAALQILRALRVA